METWSKFKKWFADTFSFTYLKKLIDSDTNDDLKDAMAVFFSFVLACVILYATYKGDNKTYLSIIQYLMYFIGSLVGLTVVKQIHHKFSDNKTDREIKIKGNGESS